MRLTTFLAIALAALTATPAMAQRKGSKAKAPRKPKQTAVIAHQPQPKPVDGKTFSYALGVAQGQSLKQYLVAREGVDSAYVSYALEAMANASQYSAEDRKKLTAQAAGLRIADMNHRNLPAFNKQASGKSDSGYVIESEYERGLRESALGAQTTLTPDSAMKVVEGQMQYQQGVYKVENLAWLDNNAKQKGVTTLPSGLQYQVITQGNGPVATDTTQVEVNYEGKLIDGTVFDSSYKRGMPATFRPSEVIAGWREALTKMPEGSTWMLYIPAKLGYGERGQGQQIPANSTLIFKVEVVKVKQPAPNAPAAQSAQPAQTKPAKAAQPAQSKATQPQTIPAAKLTPAKPAKGKKK